MLRFEISNKWVSLRILSITIIFLGLTKCARGMSRSFLEVLCISFGNINTRKLVARTLVLAEVDNGRKEQEDIAANIVSAINNNSLTRRTGTTS